MSQVERIVRNGLIMDGATGENGELLSLRDHEDEEYEHGGGGGGGGFDGTAMTGGVGYSVDEHGDPEVKKRKSRQGSLRRSDTCCDSGLSCLSRVPCGSLLSWIVLLLGLGCLVGGLLIGCRRSRDLLDDQSLLWFMEHSLIGVASGMFVVCTLFLVVGHLSSDPTSRRVFNSLRKNKCAKGLNIFVLVLCYILVAVWILMTVLLATPLVFIINFLIIHGDSFNPEVYGFKSKVYTGEALDEFEDKVENQLVCYGVALFGSFLVANSLIFFIMAVSANIKHLQDNRFATLHAYDDDAVEEARNSKHSMVDTNM